MLHFVNFIAQKPHGCLLGTIGATAPTVLSLGKYTYDTERVDRVVQSLIYSNSKKQRKEFMASFDLNLSLTQILDLATHAATGSDRIQKWRRGGIQ